MIASFESYLREIGAQPLLTREEEARLARLVRAGDEEARARLVTANLRFVVSVAKRYQHRGLPLSDLVNEGNVGLIRAAERFDESRGVRFVSYAIWWIRQAILQAVDRAAEAGPDGRPTRWVSLDMPLRPERGTRLADLVADDGEDPAETAWRHALRDTLDSSLTCLPEREERVLRLYFGLDSAPPASLDEIGRRLGVSRERVRQLKDRALARLRCGARRRQLETFHL